MTEKQAHMDTQSLVILKPDCVLRGLVHKAIEIMEGSSEIVASALVWPNSSTWTKHYSHVMEKHGRAIYERNLAHICSGPVWVFILQGPKAGETGRRVRSQMRERYMIEQPANLVHASDPDEETKEVRFWVGEFPVLAGLKQPTKRPADEM